MPRWWIPGIVRNHNAPDTLVSLCFVDDFTRVGHLGAISRTMVGLPSTEDSIAISSRAGDRPVAD